MRTEGHETQELDRTLRGLHATAASQLSHSTLARLRAGRQGLATAPRRTMGTWRWMAAGLGSAAMAVALVLRMAPLAPSSDAPVAVVPASNVYPTGLAALDEDPDFFIWLAAESAPLQLEQL